MGTGSFAKIGQTQSRIFGKDRTEWEQKHGQGYGRWGAGSLARTGLMGSRNIGNGKTD